MQAFRNRTRRQRIVHDSVEEIRHSVHAEAAETPEHTKGAQGQLARLGQALARLRDDERILLNLRYTRGLSIAELVELVGKSEAAVRKQLLRALQRLRQLMDDDASF
jgi:RNA polymerase sigma-70 factor (ECF subfamily)